jgi:hypothetical protein
MSENPFSSPPPIKSGYHEYATSGGKAPGALTIILVACLIISSLGFLGSCMGSIGTVMNQAVMQTAPPVNSSDPAANMTSKMYELNSAAMIPNLIVMGLNFMVAPMMFVGAIACLNRKSWGHNLLRWSLMAAILFVLIRGIIGVLIQIRVKSAFGDGFGNAMNKGGPEAQTMAALISGFFWVAIIFGVIWAIFQAGFYLWSLFYLNKPEVRGYLGKT